MAPKPEKEQPQTPKKPQKSTPFDKPPFKIAYEATNTKSRLILPGLAS